MSRYSFFTILTFLLFVEFAGAQTAQFALVRPDGTTYICPTLDSAYRKAVDNDAIFMPGGSFSFADSIKKKLTFWGAGISPDSTAVTGRTVIPSKVLLASSASGSSFHGIAFTYNFCSYYCDLFSIQGYGTTNIFLKNCELYGTGGLSNSVFKDCIIKSNFSCNNAVSYNCIFGSSVSTGESQYFNCLFLTQTSGTLYTIQSRFENCVFLGNDPFVHNGGQECGNVLVTNLKAGPYANLSQSCSSNPPLETGTIIQASFDDILVNYPSTAQFGYQYDYHLKATCLGHNAGTDNTDMGIYGSTSPARPGWVPDNPHIYFKNVATESNSNGQLQVQFKVRISN